jgi:hypothetical protein
MRSGKPHKVGVGVVEMSQAPVITTLQTGNFPLNEIFVSFVQVARIQSGRNITGSDTNLQRCIKLYLKICLLVLRI